MIEQKNYLSLVLFCPHDAQKPTGCHSNGVLTEFWYDLCKNTQTGLTQTAYMGNINHKQKNMTLKRIKALDRLEFEDATSNEGFYGKYKGMFAYVQLGTEREYQEQPGDDPKTQYRFFKNCDVEYSETEDQLESGIYQYKDERVNVVIYW